MEVANSTRIKQTLSSKNKAERKRGFREIWDFTEKKKLSPDFLWADFRNYLFRGIEDESESSREHSLLTLKTLANMGDPEDWACLILVLRKRRKEGEELRLLSVEVLILLMSRRSFLDVFYRDVLSLIPQYLCDPFHEVRIASCSLLSILTKGENMSISLRRGFPQILPSLLTNFNHAQRRVRQAGVMTFADFIIASGDCTSDFGESDLALTQRAFDPAPGVRLALSRTCARLLKDWRYHHAYQLRILLALLSQINDEVKEVSIETRKLWEDVAEDWIKKEIQDAERKELKDQMDFQVGLLHYPEGVSRPSFPCREYLSRFFYKILPATWMDLRDWRVETRVKTSELLSVNFLHVEHRLTEHSLKIIETLIHGTKDNEPKVIKNLMKAAYYYGFFVQSKTWVPLIRKTLEVVDGSCKTTQLRILSCIIKGSNSDDLSHFLITLADSLSSDEVCLSRNDNHCHNLLECIVSLLKVCGFECLKIQFQLFKCTLAALSLCQSNNIKIRAREIFSEVALANRLSGGTAKLFRMESPKLLEVYERSCRDWDTSSFERLMFGTLLAESDAFIYNHTDATIKIFRLVLDASNDCRPELRLQFFIYLSKQFLKAKDSLGSNEIMRECSQKFVIEVITPALKWKAGSKAEAVRTAASSSLFYMLECNLLTPDCIEPLREANLFSTMNSLLEDSSVKIRIFAVKSYELFFKLGKSHFQSQDVIRIMFALVQRMNDVNNEIRLACLKALYFADDCFNSEVTKNTFNNEFEDMFKTLLLHLDDELLEIRSEVCGLLKKLSARNPSQLKILLETDTNQHLHKEECYELCDYVESLLKL